MGALPDKILWERIFCKLNVKAYPACLATLTEDKTPWVRYVMLQTDEYLTIRICTHLSSRKVHNIQKNPEVHILAGFENFGTYNSYIQVQGIANISTAATIKELVWQPQMEMYFDGPKDPEYSVIEVKPYRIEYQPWQGTFQLLEFDRQTLKPINFNSNHLQI